MNRITAFLILFYAGSVSAQSSSRQKLDSVALLVKEYYNRKDAEGLYSLTDETFQQQLSYQKFQEVSKSLYSQFGNLNFLEWKKTSDDVARYKAAFDNSTMQMLISLNAKHKLQTFLFQQYKDEVKRKTEKVLSSNPLKTPLDRKVDSVLQAYITQVNTVGAVIGVLSGGKTYTYCYGEVKKGEAVLPDENTLYEIGSVSKTFTATLLAEFVEEGKLKLSDPVNQFLPDSIARLIFNSKPVTLESLSNHTSGLPRLPLNLYVGADITNPYKHYDDNRLFGYLKAFKPYREPGAQYEYSNLAVGLLGVVLERISGKSYEVLLEEKICKPLAMQHTLLTLQKEDSAHFAKGYNGMGQPVASWEFKSLAAAGGIRSSVKDMLLYASTFFFNPRTHNAIVILTNGSIDVSEYSVVLLRWMDKL